MSKNNNILITGGAGYIGSHVSFLLIEKGYNITIIDSLITGNKQLVPKEANLEICDITDTDKVTQILKSKKFEAVLHFAGLIRVEESVKYPEKYIEFNYNKAKIFLDICKEHGSFDKYIWSFVQGKPKVNRFKNLQEIPVTTDTAMEMSKDLKRKGFKFVGPTICYSFMQAVGMVNDHEIGCFRWKEVQNI